MRKRIAKSSRRGFRSVTASKRVRAGRKVMGRRIMASTSGTYDYLAEMIDDIKNVFDDYDWEYEDRDDLEQQMNDDLWDSDSVTGNGSGSYWLDREKARDAIRGNEDLLIEAIEEFGNSTDDYKKALTEPEWADVTIRCYLLGQAIGQVLDDMGIR